MGQVERIYVTILLFQNKTSKFTLFLFHLLLEFNHEGSGPLTQAVREFGN